MNLLKSALVVLIFGFGANSYAELYQPTELRIDQPFSQKSDRYGLLEIRHRTSTFYDDKNYLQRETPLVEAVGRVGFRLYRGRFDAFLEGGVLKGAGTQQFIQRRPVAGATYYPLQNNFGEVQIYSLVELPFVETREAGQQLPGEQGSIATVGVAPTFNYETRLDMGPIGFRVGTDIWTKVYSRRQEISLETQTERGQLGLARVISSEGKEDGQMSLDTQYKVGGYWSPDYRGDFTAEMLLLYDNHHYPFYYAEVAEVKGQKDIKNRYVTDRSSRLRLRLTWKVSRRVFLRNDFYKYYGGLYNRHPVNPQPRMSNLFYMGYDF